jgi:hypothetical protein
MAMCPMPVHPPSPPHTPTEECNIYRFFHAKIGFVNSCIVTLYVYHISFYGLTGDNLNVVYSRCVGREILESLHIC